jgi:hypothetical protein
MSHWINIFSAPLQFSILKILQPIQTTIAISGPQFLRTNLSPKKHAEKNKNFNDF